MSVEKTHTLTPPPSLPSSPPSTSSPPLIHTHARTRINVGTCPFGLAHVDTPKGDLDHSNTITTGSVLTSSTVYPYGTEEKYPDMSVTLSGGSTLLTNTAHYYMECSNKGLCDRKTGECECFDGYDGNACQRASCPNSCSGHGTCETISDLAAAEFGNIYALWDADITMGCDCDAGYAGADCSSRMCKYGIDPLYTDDTAARVTTTSVRVSTSAASALTGTYALKFYDVFGEDYTTEPIVASATGANQCLMAKAALEALPDDVISQVSCAAASAVSTNKGFDMEITFNTNPGQLKQLEVDYHLDGNEATMGVTAAAGGTMTVSTYQKGTTGEFVDYFATKCSGVTATVTEDGSGGWGADAKVGSIGYLSGLTTATENLLKACLGDSDGDATNNKDVYDWDYGYDVGNGDFLMGAFPHAIKTVPATPVPSTSKIDEGEFHLVWYDPSATNKFRVSNLPTTARKVSSNIYTTSGTVERLGVDADSTGRKNNDQNNTITGYWPAAYTNKVYTNIDASCESGDSKLFNCLQKGDKLFIVDGCWGVTTAAGIAFGGVVATGTCADETSPNKGTGNLYTITKIYNQKATATTERHDSHTQRFTSGDYENRFVVEVDYNIGWATAAGDPDGSGSSTSGVVVLFKFTPSTSTGNYEYVSQCSNRGSCDGETGLCSCFRGYTGDDCTTMSSLAI